MFEAGNPFHSGFHPSADFFWANNRTTYQKRGSDESPSAFVMAYDGGLSFANQGASICAAPSSDRVESKGALIFVANFNGGNVVVSTYNNVALATNSGDVGSVKSPADQAEAHADSITASHSVRQVLACDLGLDPSSSNHGIIRLTN